MIILQTPLSSFILIPLTKKTFTKKVCSNEIAGIVALVVQLWIKSGPPWALQLVAQLWLRIICGHILHLLTRGNSGKERINK
eukprot:25883_2